MKKLLIALVINTLLGPSLSATHVSGADLYYRYIGNSTGTPRHYEVYLTLYRMDASTSAPLGSDLVVNIKNRCRAQSRPLTVSRYVPDGMTQKPTGGVDITGYSACADSSAANYFEIEAHYYKGQIVLEDNCVYNLSWGLCCRNANIGNIKNPNFNSLYVEAFLNNIYGPNDSPEPISPGPKTFCLGEDMVWNHPMDEADGDSIRFVLAQPLHDDISPIAWETGYSANQPISTTGGVHLNDKTGRMSFEPAQVEVGVLKLLVEEYRYNTFDSSWHQIGITARDVQYLVTGTCAPGASQMNFVVSDSSGTDSIGAAQVSCGARRIHLSTSSEIFCNSIDVEDFLLMGIDDSIPTPIIGAGTDSCRDGFTSSFWLELNDSLYYDQNYLLTMTPGADSSALLSACGIALKQDTVAMFAVSCGTRIDLAEKQLQVFQLFPNPAHNELQINFLQAAAKRQVEIVHPNGKILRRYWASQQKELLNIGDLPSGIYILRSTDPQQPYSAKFQKL